MIAVLSGLVLLCVTNAFLSHITPDISIYLLHARTFVQELDRFTLSHDSKGIMLTFLLSIPVALFGANMVAAGVAQLFAHLTGAIAVFLIVRHYSSTPAATIVSLLSLAALHSYHVWGGNARPEDFGVAFILIALYAVIRQKPPYLALAGAMTACAAHTKLSLIIAPAVLFAVSIPLRLIFPDQSSHQYTWRSRLREATRDILWFLAGFVGVNAIVFGWMWLFDSIQGWYRQTIEWPIQFRLTDVPWENRWHAVMLLIQRARLEPLFYAGFVGLAAGFCSRHWRYAVLLAAVLGAELYRIAGESAGWYYLLAPLVPCLLIAVSMIAGARTRQSIGWLNWLIPLVFLWPYIYDLPRTEIATFKYQTIEGYPSPAEFFAREFRSYYKEGETLFVWYNDYQMYLLMHAPRPAPIITRHYGSVSADEQAGLREYYRINPPDWCITTSPRNEQRLPRIVGSVDHSIFVQHPDDSSSLRGPLPPTEKSGHDISPILSANLQYRLILDTGYLQGWKRIS